LQAAPSKRIEKALVAGVLTALSLGSVADAKAFDIGDAQNQPVSSNCQTFLGKFGLRDTEDYRKQLSTQSEFWDKKGGKLSKTFSEVLAS
jgi:hypothetical protein